MENLELLSVEELMALVPPVLWVYKESIYKCPHCGVCDNKQHDYKFRLSINLDGHLYYANYFSGDRTDPLFRVSFADTVKQSIVELIREIINNGFKIKDLCEVSE